MRINLTPQEVKGLLSNVERVDVEMEEYNIGRSRNSYFNRVDNIYDRFGEEIDELVFLEDGIEILRNNHDYNGESTLDEIFDTINAYDIDDIEGIRDYKENEEEYEEITEVLTLNELRKKYPDIYQNAIELFNGLEDEDMSVSYYDYDALFDCDHIEEEVDESTYGALAYWTIYFEPEYMDVKVASKVGLVPFEFEGTEYLALGGCGMDLSPKLDAYIALCHGWIPEDSKLVGSDPDYFRYVIGDTVGKEIEKKCKLDKKKYVVTFKEGESIKKESLVKDLENKPAN